MGGEAGAALEERELHEERSANDRSPRRLDQPDAGTRRAAGGEDIVNHEHTGAALQDPGVHLQLVAAVLEVVFDLDRLGRELPRLPHRDHADAELDRHRRGKQKPPRLHRRDRVDPRVAPRGHHQPHRRGERRRIG